MSTGVSEIQSQIQASLVQARDAQVARVVAMVDAMPDRGQADALIAPLRPRLAQLRPARPLGFTRLLFTPLNPVIVSHTEWQRSGVGVPRPALAALGAAVRAAMPQHAEWQGGWDSLAQDGIALWPAAAVALDRLAMPAGWATATGIAANDFTGIAGAAAAVLHEASAIERLAERRHQPEDDAVRPILSRSKARGPAALDTVVAVLLARLPSPARVAALAVEEAGSDGVTGRAIDRLAASLPNGTSDGADVREAAIEAGRVAALLDALETGASQERRTQLDAIRRDADALSRRCFTRAATQTLALAGAAMTAACDDAALAAMESCARDLRRLETAGRKLGSGDHYDTMLASTAETLRDLPGELGLADRVRLVEILAGPDKAMALLTAARSRAA